MVEEARFKETEGGLEPVSEGWFVVNVADTAWWRSDVFGATCPLEGIDEQNAPEARFQEYGINIHVVWPGQPNCMYHGEAAQEDFLVLAGECLLIIEGDERRLKAWDFVHCPPNTEHVFVGAGEEPCVIFMVGRRNPERRIVYPASEAARRHGASVESETTSAAEAYVPFGHWRAVRADHLDRLLRD
jgi:uncharacterized cupin superfamily protein